MSLKENKQFKRQKCRIVESTKMLQNCSSNLNIVSINFTDLNFANLFFSETFKAIALKKFVFMKNIILKYLCKCIIIYL